MPRDDAFLLFVMRQTKPSDELKNGKHQLNFVHRIKFTVFSICVDADSERRFNLSSSFISPFSNRCKRYDDRMSILKEIATVICNLNLCSKPPLLSPKKTDSFHFFSRDSRNGHKHRDGKVSSMILVV